MTVKWPLVFTLLFASSPAFATSEYDSGNSMLPHCKALVEGKPPGFWGGHCAGIIDTWSFVSTSLPESDRFCAPNVPPLQAQRVVVRWLETHPENLHLSFKGLALSALKEAWPCPKQ
jgi:hypothetical protein